MLSPMTQFLLDLQDAVASGPSQSGSGTSPVPPIMRFLESTPYQHPRRFTMKDNEKEHWTFSCRGTPGASLADAYHGSLEGLDAPDDVLFPAGFLKVTFLLQFPSYAPFRRAKNVQRVKRGVPLPTLRHRVVECVAEVMALFIKQAAGARPRDGGAVFGTGGIELRDLYLLKLDRHGRTLVPVLGFLPRSGVCESRWHESSGGNAPTFLCDTDANQILGTTETWPVDGF